MSSHLVFAFVILHASCGNPLDRGLVSVLLLEFVIGWHVDRLL
jgi:hypothetical protein